MPSLSTWSALGGLGEASGKSLQQLMTHRLAEQQLEVNRQEAQERQQTLENWRKAQEDKIRYDIEQDRAQMERALRYINDPNTTPEMRRWAQAVLATGQQPSADLISGMSAENKYALDQRAKDAQLERDIKLANVRGENYRGTAGERAVPPQFAQHIAEIIDKYPDLNEALDNYDYKVRTGFLVDSFGENIDTNAGRNRLSAAHRQAHLAGAREPNAAQKFVKETWESGGGNVADWVKSLNERVRGGGGGGGTPAAAPAKPTPPPGAPPGWHPPMSVVPGLRAIPDVPFSFGAEEMPPALSMPRTPRGTPSSGGPSGQEIWDRLSEAGAPGEPELPSAETIFNLLNARARKAPTEQGITFQTPRVKGKSKKKPVRLKERLQIEGYDVTPMR